MTTTIAFLKNIYTDVRRSPPPVSNTAKSIWTYFPSLNFPLQNAINSTEGIWMRFDSIDFSVIILNKNFYMFIEEKHVAAAYAQAYIAVNIDPNRIIRQDIDSIRIKVDEYVNSDIVPISSPPLHINRWK